MDDTMVCFISENEVLLMVSPWLLSAINTSSPTTNNIWIMVNLCFLKFICNCSIKCCQAANAPGRRRPCEKTISVGVFEQGLHAEVHGTCTTVLLFLKIYIFDHLFCPLIVKRHIEMNSVFLIIFLILFSQI